MARLLSVNVGLPRDISWRGRTVHTGIWKSPAAAGRVRARRLNLEGDGQGDLQGHGGVHRAVYVYQLASYRHWEAQMRRSDFTFGQFGENFTVDGLADDEVCVGDQLEIGTALFEVSQPRVTCYRVGIRMDEPRMAAMLTASGRPGFYLRVLREGEVGAGDEIRLVGQAPERMTIAELNALLYSPQHPRAKLEKALRLQALSPGWRSSFQALLDQRGRGNAGLVPSFASRPAPPGFTPHRVVRINQEAVDVFSFDLEAPPGAPLAEALPGQFIVLRLRPDPKAPPLFRSYSLSGPPSGKVRRIGVKLEPHGAAGTFLSQSVRVGDTLDASAPRGSFVLQPGNGPVVLLSAGIGATPVMAMLHALVAEASEREVWWLHAARNKRSHAFAAESRTLRQALQRCHSQILYSRPERSDQLGADFDRPGHFDAGVFADLGVPLAADFYLCGPTTFMEAMTGTLAALGVAPDRLRGELFAGGAPSTPGVVAGKQRAPHVPEGTTGTGPMVSFARSGPSTRWDAARYRSLLELAEACDVPVRWSCRTGVCHSCETGLLLGSVEYDPAPLDAPADGNLLVCCSRPKGDVVVDI